ncbi:MAG TPA: penicillin-binding protein activator, partial [Casimicrobiaceae bacterium]|nr:penicillin-binding protein activator [Casimicrobiaceae bacterium]
DGFVAAAARAGASSRVQVIAHGDNGVLPAFAAAAQRGAALAVGPLTRDDLKTVLTMAPRRPRTLALNQTDDGEPLPDAVYALTLAVEQDAVLLVRIARRQGAASIVVVASDASFQQRFAQAFIGEWRRAGGSVPRVFHFDASPEKLGSLRRQLDDDRIDAVLLAVDGNDAALAKSFLPRVRVYASSQVTDGLPVEMLYDLEGVQFVEIPWLADPQDPAFAGIERGEYDNPFLQRLYALGIDGFTLARVLAEPTPPDQVELDGATGRLSLSASHIFAREGRLMTIHDGRVLAEPTAQ